MLEKTIDRIEDYLIEHKIILLIVSGIILFLAYTGKLPATFTPETQSILGSFGTFAISIAAVLVLVAIGMIAMFKDEQDGTLLFVPVFLIIAAILLVVSGIGALLTEVIVFIQTIPGVILTVFVGLIILTKMKFFRMFK